MCKPVKEFSKKKIITRFANGKFVENFGWYDM